MYAVSRSNSFTSEYALPKRKSFFYADSFAKPHNSMQNAYNIDMRKKLFAGCMAALTALTMAGCASHTIAVTPLNVDDSADDLESYTRLTDQERSAFEPVAFDEALKLFDEGGTGMVVYSADWCPYCQRALPVLADVALEENVPVYYVSFSDGSVTADQIDTLSRHLDWIEFAAADDGKEHAASFQIPSVIAVKNGEAVGHHISLFDDLSIQSSDFELNDDQKAQLKDIYKGMFETLRGQAGSVSAPDPTNSGGAACENIGNGC